MSEDNHTLAEISGKTARQMPVGRRFQPGVSGNPGGRPRKSKLTDASRQWLETVDLESGKTNAELVAAALGKRALRGDAEAFRALADRAEGKPMQPLQVANVTPEHMLGPDLLKMNRREMLAYAERGELPEWFDSGREESDDERETNQPSQ